MIIIMQKFEEMAVAYQGNNENKIQNIIIYILFLGITNMKGYFPVSGIVILMQCLFTMNKHCVTPILFYKIFTSLPP